MRVAKQRSSFFHWVNYHRLSLLHIKWQIALIERCKSQKLWMGNCSLCIHRWWNQNNVKLLERSTEDVSSWKHAKQACYKYNYLSEYLMFDNRNPFINMAGQRQRLGWFDNWAFIIINWAKHNLFLHLLSFTKHSSANISLSNSRSSEDGASILHWERRLDVFMGA